MRVHYERKRARVRVDHDKRAMARELTIIKTAGVRVDTEKKSDVLRVHHEKERWDESSQ